MSNQPDVSSLALETPEQEAPVVGETQIATVEAAPPVGRTRPGLLLRRGVREVIGVIIPAILAALLIQMFVAQTTRVESYSMEPTLYKRQRLVIRRSAITCMHQGGATSSCSTRLMAATLP